MERVNEFAFYTLGKALRGVSDIYGNTMGAFAWFACNPAREALDKLLGGDPIPLGVSNGKAKELRDFLESIEAEATERPDDGEQSVGLMLTGKAGPDIPAWRWDHGRQAIANFEAIFAEEMKEVATYFVPRRGIFATPALIDSADDSFPRDIAPFIPEKAKIEWRAAGRCLAFSLLSASGFHVARAVEAMLEAYYQFFSGKPGATERGWHDYIQELDKLAESPAAGSGPSEKTRAELRQMKDDYRNPIMHPRVVLDESDARMLFANGESLIIAMAQELKAAGGGAVAVPIATGTP